VEINASAQVTDPKVIRSLGLGLDEKAIDAVMQWKFKPGTDRPEPDAIAYLQNHGCETDRMNYSRARRLGLALGTGNLEATCMVC
jgi:hypothetical protein